MTFIKSNNRLAKIVQNVDVRLADDGEIFVNVPNEIFNHYKNEDAYKNAFASDGWYGTNVIGKNTPSGIIIVKQKSSEKESFREEKLIASAMQIVIEGKCHYISSSLIMGAKGNCPVAILFPDKSSLSRPDYEISPMEGCFCPRDLKELGKCLAGCLNDANCEIGQRFTKINTFLIVDDGTASPKPLL